MCACVRECVRVCVQACKVCVLAYFFFFFFFAFYVKKSYITDSTNVSSNIFSICIIIIT